MWNALTQMMWPNSCVGCSTFCHKALCASCQASLTHYPLHCLVCEGSTSYGQTHIWCLKQARHITSTCVVWQYESVARALVRTWKYTYTNKLCDEYIGQFLASFFTFDQPWLYNFSRNEALHLIPVPMTSHKRKQRGFNQSKLLARHLKTILLERSFKVINHNRLVSRVIQRHRQAGSELHTRALNVQGSFALTGKAPRMKQVIIVDDVVSTGSTAFEVARLLHPYAATLHLFALARG